MSEAPSLPAYNIGIRYPIGMNPFKAGSLLMKVAKSGVGSKKGKIVDRKGGGKGKLSKSTVKTITSSKK